HKLIYAPMSDVGGILHDKDAVYINVPGVLSKNDQIGPLDLTEGERLVMNLQETRSTIADKIKETGVRLFSESQPLKAVSPNESQHDGSHDSESEDEEDANDEAAASDSGFDSETGLEDDDGDSDGSNDEDFDDEDGGDEVENIASDGRRRRRATVKAVESLRGSVNDQDAGGLEFADSDSDLGDGDDERIYNAINEDGSLRWKDRILEKAEESFKAASKDNLMKLVYGAEATPTRTASQPEDDEDSIFAKEEDTNGDFEDLESGVVVTGSQSQKGEEGMEQDDQEQSEEELRKKREQLKRKFDSLYDGELDEEPGSTNVYDTAKDEMAQQKALNEAQLAELDPESRAAIEGRRAGTYVRIVLKNVPHEFITYFNPRFPVILGGLNSSEEAFGFSQVRIKKHRWHRKILKTNDPLVLSIGWRRFQTLPLFSLSDGTRNKMLKYTPEHMHCLATFY
ncbi:Glycoside hydrolase 2 (Mannanase, beta-galactosidase), partial [Cladochytrium tenue]